MRNHPHTVVSSFLRPHASLAQSASRIWQYCTHLHTGICSALAPSPAVQLPSILTNVPIHRLDIISRIAFGHGSKAITTTFAFVPPQEPASDTALIRSCWIHLNTSFTNSAFLMRRCMCLPADYASTATSGEAGVVTML